MNLIVEPAPSGIRGVDTIAVFTPYLAAAVKKEFEFAVRYLGHLSLSEADVILQSGLGLLVLAGYSRRPGWVPTGDMGAADGAGAVAHARGLGLLPDMSIFIDLEGVSASVSAQTCEDYVNEQAEAIIDAGYKAGLYVGYGVPLSPYELYHNLRVTDYWKSISHVQDVAERGYQMVQELPGNRHMFGTMVDVDLITTDHKGDTPHWMIANGE